MAGLVPPIHVFFCCETAKTWMLGTRLRQGFAEALSALARRSFSEGGKVGHDGVWGEAQVGLRTSHQPAMKLGVRLKRRSREILQDASRLGP